MKNFLIVVGLLAVLVSSASATLRNDTRTITVRTAINTYVSDKKLELGTGANYTFTVRTDMSGSTSGTYKNCEIVLNGGILNIAVGNPDAGLEMPDNYSTNTANGFVKVTINSGTMRVARIQNWGAARKASIVINGGSLQVDQYYLEGSGNWDPAQWALAGSLLTTTPGKELKFQDLGGGAVKITIGDPIPEPATLALLGLGALAMRRKRK